MKIIAEIAQAHEGSLGIAHSYIDALAKTGVDAIKFQTHIAEAESSEYEPFRVNFSYEDLTRYDYWQRMEFSIEQWAGLKRHCEECGIEFISSPFSIAAVDLLEKLSVKTYKIGSGEVTNSLMLEKIVKTGKDIILSSGMSSFAELDIAVNNVLKGGNNLLILQCTTAYPTQPHDWGLNILQELRSRYKNASIGFSDHSGEIYACLAATALQAEVLEFHAVFDKRMFGPDAKASLTIDQVNDLVKGVRKIEESINTHIDKDNIEVFKPLKQMFEKSLAINQNVKSGEIITLTHLEAKKPSGKGIPASEYENIIGKSFNKDMKRWDFLTYDDIK